MKVAPDLVADVAGLFKVLAVLFGLMTATIPAANSETGRVPEPEHVSVLTAGVRSASGAARTQTSRPEPPSLSSPSARPQV